MNGLISKNEEVKEEFHAKGLLDNAVTRYLPIVQYI